jgi:hypothetical protein
VKILKIGVIVAVVEESPLSAVAASRDAVGKPGITNYPNFTMLKTYQFYIILSINGIASPPCT